MKDKSTVSPNVPESWHVDKVSAVALKLYDSVFLLGPRIHFDEWWGQFFKETPHASARRTWERWKSDFRAAGIEFKSEAHVEDPSRVESIVFESRAYAMAMVDALIGPADVELEGGAKLLCIYDFFPGESHEDVDALMDSLADSLSEED